MCGSERDSFRLNSDLLCFICRMQLWRGRTRKLRREQASKSEATIETRRFRKIVFPKRTVGNNNKMRFRSLFNRECSFPCIRILGCVNGPVHYSLDEILTSFSIGSKKPLEMRDSVTVDKNYSVSSRKRQLEFQLLIYRFSSTKSRTPSVREPSSLENVGSAKGTTKNRNIELIIDSVPVPCSVVETGPEVRNWSVANTIRAFFFISNVIGRSFQPQKLPIRHAVRQLSK